MVGRVGLLLILAIALLTCGQPPAPAKPAAPTQQAPAQPAAPAPSAASGAPAARPAVQPLNPIVRVKYGTQEQVSGASLYIAAEKGYFAEEGLEVEFTRIGGGPDAAPALATGDLDFAQGAMDPATFNAILRGIPLKFVTHLSLNREDAVTSGLMIRQDVIDSGRYRDPQDLRGLTVGTGPAAGSITELFLSRVLDHWGLTLADVQPVNLSYVDMTTALSNARLDAAWNIQPFITALESRGVAKMVAPLGQFYPGAVTNTLLISPVFAERQPEAARRFVTAQVRGQRDFWHAFIKQDNVAGQEAIIEALTKYTPVKDPQQWRETIMPGVGLNGELSDAIVDDYQDYFVKAGSQREKLATAKVVDHSYVEYALDRLGREAY
ncbi:MAG TPA: ABC transporter substrate-binding protein [Chloroflexota bacterium]|jgi:NitT/TauT family transport system substrate-binding protein